MHLQKVSRQQVKIKLALQGPSGSGKSIGSLLIAKGLCNDWNKIVVIDSENGSSNLYANKGTYNTLSIEPPFSPEKYIQAIKLCEEQGMEVIIIDSVSHEWESTGGILDLHSKMVGNSFTNWAKLTSRHNQFVQAMLQSKAHIVATIRSKQDYVLNEKNGKMVPEKVGLKGIQRDGLDFEFTIVFDLDIKHNASCSKDRTSLFMDQPEFMIIEQTGGIINSWCNEGALLVDRVGEITTNVISESELIQKIQGCKSSEELLVLYNQQPLYQESHLEEFSKRRQQLSQHTYHKPINHHLNH